MGSQFIGLMRHAASWYEGMDPAKRSETRELTVDGERGAAGVARVFEDYLQRTGLEPAGIRVYDVGTKQSSATARILHRTLQARSDIGTLDGLAPASLSAYTTRAGDVTAAWEKASEALAGEHYVVVGHDPQMSWILHELLGRKAAKRYPLATGELMWFESTETTKRVRGVFSPTDEETARELATKIKSKMDAAKVLGTFITGLVTFAATQVLDGRVSSSGYTALAAFGLTCLALSAVLYFITLFWYDELLMPKRFWGTAARGDRGGPGAASSDGRHKNGQAGKGEGPSEGATDAGFVTRLRPRLRSADRFTIRRPPASYWWVLYENMIHVWTWAFIPATGLAGLGVVSLAVALAQPAGGSWLAVAAAIATVAGAGAWFGIYSRPRLGVND